MKYIFSLVLTLVMGAISLQAQSWPAGKADYQTATIAADSTVSIDVTNRLTYVTVPTLTNNITVHLDVAKLQKGAFLFFELPCGSSAKSTTWGDKIDGPVLSGTSNKTKICGFLWNGTTYKKISEVLLN